MLWCSIVYTEMQMEDIEDEGHETGVGIQGNWLANWLSNGDQLHQP